ncbi:MAG TPA: glutamate--tRNA ligase [Candidatus Saccharimonadales bacterium]|nr:glutamate--tRNA ligase [Candidatus Saccharimonadales bacterium]
MVRTRFAPSPTGFLHVGGVRTALFAWLVARQSNGQFLLRIEDTDKAREVEGSEQHILDCLQWLGLDWDEEPYKQSQRLEIYKEWAQKLIDGGRAYADTYSPEGLNELREKAKSQKKAFLFRDYRPENPPRWDGSQPLRFKSDPKAYEWEDAVMGRLSAGPEVVDDFIILKSDGFPTYNFAHIVDDHLMKISHVIRTQEFLPSVPKFLNLYEALEIEHPVLTTLPYVMDPDGKKKLSKRDGAKDILDYKKEGYLPEALINFLATLGWNNGTDQEIYSKDELIKKFSLGRVQRGGAKFDDRRLEWMNGYYIRQKPLDELYKLAGTFWPQSVKNHPDEYKKKVLKLVQERLKHFSELPGLTNFFFEDLPVDLGLIDGDKQLSLLGRGQQKGLLELASERLAQSDFSEKGLTDTLNNLLKETDQKPAALFSLIRIATTWAPASPGLADTLALLGKDRSLERLKSSITALG